MEATAAQQQGPKFPIRGSDYHPLPQGGQHGRVLSHAVQTIKASPEQVYNTYARIELLPAWQENVVAVTATGENTLHWVVQEPLTGTHLEFESEIVEAVPGKRHVSRVTTGPFATTVVTLLLEEDTTGRGTRATFINDFKLPGGIVANALAAVASRSPEQLTIENLRHLKQLIESHEIPSVEGQPAGPRGIIGKWKELLLGENLPTPPGTSDRARERDFAEPNTPAFNNLPLLVGTVAAVAGLAAWYGVRRLR